MSAPYSTARRAGDIVVFSGLLGRRDGAPVVGLEAQLDCLFEQLDLRLAEQDLTRADIFKTTVWLADVEDWTAMNVPYVRYFDGLVLPARSAVGAQLQPGCLVEIEAWAFRTGSSLADPAVSNPER